MRTHLEEHLGEVRRVHDIAPRFRMNRRTLEPRLREALDLSPHGFLQRMRLHRALTLLQEVPRETTIRELCRQAGFTSLPHMHPLFRIRMGWPPALLREAFLPDSR